MFTYENQGTNTYLVYQFQPEDEIDTVSIGMVSNNSINGVAPIVITQMDTDKFVKFNISAMIGLDQFFGGTVNRKRLIDVFSNICDTLCEAEEYMIDANAFLLSLDRIYVDVSTNRTALLCFPVLNNREQLDIKMFFKEIMFGTKFDDSEDCSYVAKIVNYLNSSQAFDLLDFKRQLEEVGKQQEAVKVTTKPVVQNVPAAKPAVQSVQPSVAVQSSEPVPPPVQPSAGTGYSVAKLVEKQEQLKVQNEASAAQTSKASNSFGIPGLSRKTEKKAEEKPDKKHEKKQEKKSGGLFGGKKKAKEEAAPAMPMSPGFKIPGMDTEEAGMISSATSGFAIPGNKSATYGEPPAAMPMSSASQSASASSTPVSQPGVSAPAIVQQPIKTAQPQVVSKPANFGNTTVLNVPQSNATTVLDASVMPGMEPVTKPYLIRKKNNETIPIDKNEYRLGKERSFVDYFIGDNTAISRSHACIVYHDNEYFVMDTNSTNHTFVNDIMIQSNVETKLESGTKIRLADEEFEFKMM